MAKERQECRAPCTLLHARRPLDYQRLAERASRKPASTKGDAPDPVRPVGCQLGDLVCYLTNLADDLQKWFVHDTIDRAVVPQVAQEFREIASALENGSIDRRGPTHSATAPPHVLGARRRGVRIRRRPPVLTDRQIIACVPLQRYIARMRFEKVWIEQCRATKAIRRRFGAKSALDYLIGEKLMMFADAAKRDPKFAKELPRFLTAVWQMFNQYELIGYTASQKPATRKSLRQLLYLP